jgi:glycosyltransferase involved in cell wall biosynthesis
MTDTDTSGSASPHPVQVLLHSSLFDPLYYARAAGISGSPAELAQHYLAKGEAASLPPGPGFDSRFYRACNPDVTETGMNLLLHYIQFGQNEYRYPTLARLHADAAQVEASGLFDARAYAWDRGRPSLPGLSELEDYLVARDNQAGIGDRFDSGLYAHLYPDALQGHGLPLLHYLATGRAQHRVVTMHDLNQRKAAERPRFNTRHYLGQLPPGTPVGDPLEHYLLYGALAGLDPAPDFSADYYMRRYPDMHASGMDPFYHYAAHGKAEGRVGRPDFTDAIWPGGTAFDLAKPTILVASHEASRTGAPLVGLNVGARMAEGWNVISYLARGGPLLENFSAHSCLVVLSNVDTLDGEYLLAQLQRTHRLSAVLLNSVETSSLAPAALQAGLPSVALVHEFAEYTLPPGRMTSVLESADRVVTPAALIRDSLQTELERTRAGPANSITVRPQGYLPILPPEGADADLTRDEILALAGVFPDAMKPGRKVRFVLGAGYVQMRKGVDLFVQTAAEVRRLHGEDVRFLWVGDGYHPTRDLAYSAWVADMVRRLDLERTLFFLPSQSSLDVLFALSDVFYLPSRLDPFPNVVLDAFKAGRGVVCFHNATGVAGLLGGPDGAGGAAVAFCNVGEAAQALIRAFRPAEAKRALQNAALADRRFAFADYMAALGGELDAARASQALVAAAAEQVERNGGFDAAFHGGAAHAADAAGTRRAIRLYAAQGVKGLLQFSPKPGFNEGLGRITAGCSPALGVPGAPASTHRCILLDKDLAPPFSGRVALHLHLHYPELTAGMLDALAEAGCAADLIVTTTSEDARLEVAYALRKYRAGSVRLVVVPNRGRDIGPFLSMVGPLVQGGAYDIVGHLHGKRSLAIDASMGDRWRSYLLGILLGGGSGLGGALAPFMQDPGLGLLFAEDRHLVGWTRNRAPAEALAVRMVPPPALPEWPVFPLGTMFWARPAALAPLWSLGLQAADFPPEPAAGDGTILHAIERLLPAVCEATGYGWATLYVGGTGWY